MRLISFSFLPSILESREREAWTRETYPFNPFKLSEPRSCHSLAIWGPLSLDFPPLFPSRVEGQLPLDVGTHLPKSSDTHTAELLLQNLLFPNICKICWCSVDEGTDFYLPILGVQIPNCVLGNSLTFLRTHRKI